MPLKKRRDVTNVFRQSDKKSLFKVNELKYSDFIFTPFSYNQNITVA